MKLNELIAKMEAKRKDLDTLLAKGQEMTFDDVQVGKAIKDEIVGLKSQIEAFNAVADMRSISEDADNFVNASATGGMRHGAETPASNPGMSQFLGNQHAGTTWMYRNKDGSIDVNSIGAGLFGEKKWKALNTPDYKSAFVAMIMKGERGLSAGEYKTLQDGLDDQGGFFAPPDYTLSLIQREPTPTNVNPNVFKWQTRSDAKIFPKIPYSGATDDPNAVLYSTGVRVVYPGEIPAADNTVDTTEPAFGEFRVEVHTAMFSIPITRNMLDDSWMSVLSFIQGKFQETDDLELDNRILNGTGVGQAAGILRNPSANATDPNEPQFIKTTAASTLTYNGLYNLFYGLAPQYIPRAKVVMNWQGTALAINKLTDTTGRTLWSDGLADNGLSTSILNRRLLGFPPIYSEFMPSPAANTYPMIFGDLMGYYLVERLGLSMQVLDQTRAKRNQIEILARRRFGGAIAEPYRLKVAKCST